MGKSDFLIYVPAFILFILSVFWKEEMVSIFGHITLMILYTTAGVAVFIKMFLFNRKK